MNQIIKIICIFIPFIVFSAQAIEVSIYQHDYTSVLLLENDNKYFLVAEGSAHPKSNAATCLIKAELSENQVGLEGVLKSVDIDVYSYDITEKRSISVSSKNKNLKISGVNTFGLCGLGVDFNGSYTYLNVDTKEYINELEILISLMNKQEKSDFFGSISPIHKIHTEYLNFYRKKEYGSLKNGISKLNEHIYLILYPLASDLNLYNDIAFFMEQSGEYKRASLLLEKIIADFPNRTVAYINLGDSYWGLNDKSKAKHAYQRYIELMKAANKEKKIPARVLNRL